MPNPWAGGVALAAGLAGGALALHHPLGGLAANAVFALFAACAWRWRGTVLTALPALLPVVALAPWTGWLTVEEFDLLLLAAAFGAYARLALPARPQQGQGGWRLPATSILAWAVLALMLLSTGWALMRGVADAGGWAWGWTQGYREPMNSLRLAKPLVGALLWWPLWRAACREDPAGSELALLRGLTLGLAACALAALWERAAFTDVLNFSSDYRTTALFWEMHVGGAALDGYLAMTLPFAAQLALRTQRPLDLGLAWVTLVLAGYAALTTFSRIVYLALPAGLMLMGGLMVLQRLRGAPAAARGELWRELLPGVALVLGFALGAASMFGSSGYRGLLALFGCLALMLPLAAVLRGFRAAEWSAGLVLGLVMAALAWAATLVMLKGAYVAYGLAALFTAAMLAWQMRRGGRLAHRGPDMPGALALAGFVSVLTATVLVADKWGYERGWHDALPVVLVFAAVLAVAGRRRQGLWPAGLRWQALLAAVSIPAAAAVAVFAGGAYMTERVQASQGDLSGREAHWRAGLSLLRTTEQQLLGLGLGRYLDEYAVAAGQGERPGDYRYRSEEGNGYLVLTAGTHVQGWGEILRVSQRISLPQGGTTVQFRARSDKPAGLHFDVCRKHLLYDDGSCQTKGVTVPATQGHWQSFTAVLDGNALAPERGWLPRFVMFSIGTQTTGASVDVDDLSLRDASGRELLHNGGFDDAGSGELARWFFSSDRNHLPWHAKNLQVHLLVEQGALGLAAFTLLWFAAFWRVTVGSAKSLPLAPALAAALLGFAIVGLVDSLLDMPRVAWQFYALALVALTLAAPYRSSARRTRDPGAAVG